MGNFQVRGPRAEVQGKDEPGSKSSENKRGQEGGKEGTGATES